MIKQFYSIFLFTYAASLAADKMILHNTVKDGEIVKKENIIITKELFQKRKTLIIRNDLRYFTRPKTLLVINPKHNLKHGVFIYNNKNYINTFYLFVTQTSNKITFKTGQKSITFSILIDTDPPQINLRVSPGFHLISNNFILPKLNRIYLYAFDRGAGLKALKYTLHKDWNKVDGPLTLKPYHKSLGVTAFDRLSNAITNHYKIFFDEDAPDIQINVRGNRWEFKKKNLLQFSENKITIDLKAQDNYSSKVKLFYSLNTLRFKPYFNPVVIKDDAVLFYYAEDDCRNLSPIFKLRIKKGPLSELKIKVR